MLFRSYLVDRTVASQCCDDLEIRGVRPGQVRGVSGRVGEFSGCRVAKCLELRLCLCQKQFPTPPSGHRIGDKQDALGGHEKWSTKLLDPVAGDGAQIAVPVRFDGIGREVKLLKFANG